jgi:hypothetical protein
VWKSWKDNSGAKIIVLYKTYVDWSDEPAVANGKLTDWHFTLPF